MPSCDDLECNITCLVLANSFDVSHGVILDDSSYVHADTVSMQQCCHGPFTARLLLVVVTVSLMCIQAALSWCTTLPNSSLCLHS